MRYFFKISLIVLALLLLNVSFILANDYNEAPMLTKLVDSGELPPIEERLPEEPYVVDPTESIGKYGGTLRVATTYANSPLGAAFVMDSLTGFVEPYPDASGVHPVLAKEVEPSEDTTTFTFYLRKGLKWSDGIPFTTEDIKFWYEDVLQNKELTPVPHASLVVAGELVKLNIIDDYTFQFIFPKPQPFFPEFPLSKLTQQTRILTAKHYFKNLHPNYVSKEALTKKSKEAGYGTWFEYFLAKKEGYCGLSSVTGVPSLAPFIPVEVDSSHRVFKRNPYYWKVDPEGNQLPYIDGIDSEIVATTEVLDGKIISGALDFEGFLTSSKNIPMYKQYETKGDYRVNFWKSGKGSDVLYMFNLTDTDPVLRKIFQDVRFRKAMSLAIDRDDINTSLYFGKAEPRQYTVLESSRYYEPEFATSYIEYNPDRAVELLEEMGLKKDAEGYFLRPDGKRLKFNILFSTNEDPLKLNVTELVVEFWNKVGVEAIMKQVSGDLFQTRADANNIEVTLNHGDKSTDIIYPARNPFVHPGWGERAWPLWLDYWEQGIELEDGYEVTPEAQQLRDMSEEILITPEVDKRIELGKKILKSQADNLWFVGIVGNAPHPVIVKNRVHNVPETGLWTWDTHWTCAVDACQFYIDE